MIRMRRSVLIPVLITPVLIAILLVKQQFKNDHHRGNIQMADVKNNTAATASATAAAATTTTTIAEQATPPSAAVSLAASWLEGLHVPTQFFAAISSNDSTTPAWMQRSREGRYSVDVQSAATTFLTETSWLCYAGLLHSRLHLHRFHRRQWRQRAFRGAYSTCHPSHHFRFANESLHREVWDVCSWRSRLGTKALETATSIAAPSEVFTVEVNLREGLGNQLFQLSFAELLARAISVPRSKSPLGASPSSSSFAAEVRVVGLPDVSLNKRALKPFFYQDRQQQPEGHGGGDSGAQESRCRAPRAGGEAAEQQQQPSSLDKLLHAFSFAAASKVRVSHDSEGVESRGVVLSDKPSYATSASKTGFPPFVFQLLLLVSALASPTSGVRCLTLDGYFQEMGYYWKFAKDPQQRRQGGLPPPPSIAASAAPPPLPLPTASGTTAVHVRRCDTVRKRARATRRNVVERDGEAEAGARQLKNGFYPALPHSYYLSAMLEERATNATATPPHAVVVTTQNCRDSSAVQRLRSMANTSLAGDGAAATTADHFSILRSATSLVLSVGTFSWWACWLGLTAAEPARLRSVHIPLVGCQRRQLPLLPISSHDNGTMNGVPPPRFVYYTPELQSSSRRITWRIQRHGIFGP